MNSIQIASRASNIKPSLIRGLRDHAQPSSLDLGLGQTDLPIAPNVTQALTRCLAQSPTAPYCPNLGLMRMRQAVADRYGLTPEEVMITCGVQQALAVALLGLIQPGDEVLVCEPAFPAYHNLIAMAQGVVVSVALDANDHWRLDVDAVENAITSRTRAILINSPNNPTGAVHAKKDLEDVLALCAKHNITWISDEIYEDYVYDEHKHWSPADFEAYRHLGVRLSGVSKSHHMMGWRLGWMTGPVDVINALKPLHQHMVTSASTLSQEAAIASLAQHDAGLARTLSIFEQRRQLVHQKLAQVEGVQFWPGQGAFYLFLDVRDILAHIGSSLDLAMHILKDVDVITIPGSGFGDVGEGYLRLAYTIDEVPLAMALERLQDCFKRLTT